MFRVIYERCYGDVYKYVARRAGTADAADLTADVFTIAWRRFPAEATERPLPWLYTVARNVLANHHRSRAKEHDASHLLAADEEGGPDVADQVSSRIAVRQAWSRLSDKDREALALIGWEGLSVTDAAKAVGCSAAAFSVRLMRARARLRHQLTRADPDSGIAPRTPDRKTGVTP